MIYIVNLKCTIKTIDPEDKYNLPLKIQKEHDQVEHGRDLSELIKKELDALGEWLTAVIPPPEPGTSKVILMPGREKEPKS